MSRDECQGRFRVHRLPSATVKLSVNLGRAVLKTSPINMTKRNGFTVDLQARIFEIQSRCHPPREQLSLQRSASVSVVFAPPHYHRKARSQDGDSEMQCLLSADIPPYELAQGRLLGFMEHLCQHELGCKAIKATTGL